MTEKQLTSGSAGVLARRYSNKIGSEECGRGRPRSQDSHKEELATKLGEISGLE